MKTLSKLARIAMLVAVSLGAHAAPLAWQDSLKPLPPSEWNRDRAAHLLERAGFVEIRIETAREASSRRPDEAAFFHYVTCRRG